MSFRVPVCDGCSGPMPDDGVELLRIAPHAGGGNMPETDKPWHLCPRCGGIVGKFIKAMPTIAGLHREEPVSFHVVTESTQVKRPDIYLGGDVSHLT